MNGDIDTPVETRTDPSTIEIDLLMGDLRCMQEDAALNYPAHLVSRCGATSARHVEVVTIYRRHASDHATAHGARSLEAPIDCVIRKPYGERVVRTINGEYADYRMHSILGAVNAAYGDAGC